jgi:hypothetical protein
LGLVNGIIGEGNGMTELRKEELEALNARIDMPNGNDSNLPKWDYSKSIDYNIAATIAMLIKSGAIQGDSEKFTSRVIKHFEKEGYTVGKQKIREEMENLLRNP